MNSEQTSKKNKKSITKTIDIEESIESVKKNVKNIKKSVDTEINNISEKDKKKEVQYSFNNNLTFNEVFKYIDNINLTPKLKFFVKNFKLYLEENRFDNAYFSNLSNMIYNYKLIISTLTYFGDMHKELDFEISLIYEIPKNLINNNKDIFEKTKFDLNKKNIVFDSSPITFDNINVEKNIPNISKRKYLLECTSDNHINEIIMTIYITWLLIIIHIKTFTNMIENSKDEKEKNILEKLLDKFTPINTDTNIYIKPFISLLKKKTLRTNKKNENKKEKSVNQDITSIQDNNIHENKKENNNIILKDDDEDEDNDDNNIIKSNLKMKNISNFKNKNYSDSSEDEEEEK